MSRYWHRRRNKPARIEDLILFLILIAAGTIFYPPIRPVIYSLWYIYAIAFVVIVIMICIKIYHSCRLTKAGIDEIDKMSGSDFELYLQNLFSKLGYKVQHTGKTGDYGSDLIIEKNGVRTAVQAKRYHERVGPDAVREINTVLKFRNCSNGMVVTNSFYTDEAILLAKANNIQLWNRNDLVNAILHTKTSSNISQIG